MTTYKPEDVTDVQKKLDKRIREWSKNNTEYDKVSIDLLGCLYEPSTDGSVIIKLTALYEGDKIVLGRFRYSGFPYNCGCVILYDLTTFWKSRIGIGTLLLDCAEIIAYESNYSCMMATTNSAYLNQIFYMMAIKNGWEEIDSFHNSRSGNGCNILVKKL